MGKQSEVTQNVSLIGNSSVNKTTNTNRQNKLKFNIMSKQRSYLFLRDSQNPEAKSSAPLSLDLPQPWKTIPTIYKVVGEIVHNNILFHSSEFCTGLQRV